MDKKSIFSLCFLGILMIVFSSCRDEKSVLGKTYSDNPIAKVAANGSNPTSVTNANKFVAEDIARSFMSDIDEKFLFARMKNIDSILDEGGKTAMYIVNFYPEGYVITSADVRNEPIFSFSTKGSFRNIDSQTPSGLVTLIKGTIVCNKLIREQMKNDDFIRLYMIDNIYDWCGKSYDIYRRVPKFGFTVGHPSNDLLIAQVCLEKYIEKEDNSEHYTPHCNYDKYIGAKTIFSVGELIKTAWNQEEPYNYYVKKHYPTGCVAVAIGQIMKFHQHPSWCYNWDIMPDNCTSSYETMTNGDREVAVLLEQAGRAVGTWYCSSGSSAADASARGALVNTFKYSKDADLDPFDYNRVKNELRNYKRPIYFGAYTSKCIFASGHAFIIDGYKLIRNYYRGIGDTCTLDKEYLHFNFGWGGNYISYNAWYRSYVQFFENGSSKFTIDFPSDANYQYRLSCIYDIHP